MKGTNALWMSALILLGAWASAPALAHSGGHGGGGHGGGGHGGGFHGGSGLR